MTDDEGEGELPSPDLVSSASDSKFERYCLMFESLIKMWCVAYNICESTTKTDQLHSGGLACAHCLYYIIPSDHPSKGQF